MGNGVKVKYDELESLSTQLGHIVDEFENAGSRRKDLEGAVDSPYGLNDLRDVAHDFEGRWDDRRKRLMGNCQTVADRVDDVIKGFREFDEDAAKKSGNR